MAKKISDFRALRNFSKWFNPETITNNVITYLLEEGKTIMRQAYESRDWQNRTYNLHDSYVCAVFVNGELKRWATLGMEDGQGHTQKIRMYGEDSQGDFGVTGKQEAENFVRSYIATHGREKGIKLVVAAVMFYANILETGAGNLKRKYRVISHVSAEFDRMKSQGINVKTASYVGAPFNSIRIPGVIIRRNDMAEGGRTFTNWKQ